MGQLGIDEAIVWPQQGRLLEAWATRLRQAREEFAEDAPMRSLVESAAGDYITALADAQPWADLLFAAAAAVPHGAAEVVRAPVGHQAARIVVVPAEVEVESIRVECPLRRRAELGDPVLVVGKGGRSRSCCALRRSARGVRGDALQQVAPSADVARVVHDRHLGQQPSQLGR